MFILPVAEGFIGPTALPLQISEAQLALISSLQISLELIERIVSQELQTLRLISQYASDDSRHFPLLR